MELLSCNVNEHQWKMIKNAFNKGELIVYPTDTLYALGANPFDKKAIENLFNVKSRPLDLPSTIAVSNIEMIEKIAIVNNLARKIIEHFLPGPLTILLMEKESRLAPHISNRGLIGIRVPRHPLALELINLLGPITATSANKHKGKEPVMVEDAIQQLGNDVTYYIDCGPCELAKPSTIIDVSTNELKLVREGAFSLKQLRSFLNG